jgi:hypothetical protein
MDRVYKGLNENEYKMAHYLVTNIDGKLIWIDYISSLKWMLEWNSIILKEGKSKFGIACIKKENKNRKQIESIFYTSLKKGKKKKDLLPFHLYFGGVPRQKQKMGMREYEKFLIYKYRDQLYRFIYKNEFSLSRNDLTEFVNFAITQKYCDAIKEGWPISTFMLSIIAPLEIFFNIPLIVRGESMEGLSELRKKISEILSKKEEIEINDEEWAYCAGAFYRYLIDQSKAKSKTLQLEPIMNSTTINNILDILSRTLEKYQHKIKQSFVAKWGNISAVAFVPSNKNKNFEELKPVFYAGFVDSFALQKFYEKEVV